VYINNTKGNSKTEIFLKERNLKKRMHQSVQVHHPAIAIYPAVRSDRKDAKKKTKKGYQEIEEKLQKNASETPFYFSLRNAPNFQRKQVQSQVK